MMRRFGLGLFFSCVLGVCTILASIGSAREGAETPLARGATMYFCAAGDSLLWEAVPALGALADVYGKYGVSLNLCRCGGKEASHSRYLVGNTVFALTDSLQHVVLEYDNVEELNLYRIYQVVHGRICGLRRLSFMEHAGRVLGAAFVNRQDGSDKATRPQLLSMLSGHGPVLFMPPGCSECMLTKYLARLSQFIHDYPESQVVAFSQGSVDVLTKIGWYGDEHLLLESSESILLGLRRQGSYMPIVFDIDGTGQLRGRLLASYEGGGE